VFATGRLDPVHIAVRDPCCGRSLPAGFRRVVVVVLARAPDVMHGLRGGELVPAVEHRVKTSRAAPFSGISRLLVSFLLCPT
jgi:hypothetical protein